MSRRVFVFNGNWHHCEILLICWITPLSTQNSVSWFQILSQIPPKNHGVLENVVFYVCFKSHTDVSNIRWLGCWAPWVPGSITVRGGGLCYVPAIPTAAAEQNHRSYTVRTRHEGGRRTLTGYQATLPKDNGALLQVHRLCNTGEKSHNLVCEEICPFFALTTLRLWTVEQTTRSG